MSLLQKYLLEQMLDEGLDDSYERFYREQMSREDFDRVIAIDPTFRIAADRIGTYGKWLLNMHIKGEDLSDAQEINDQLRYFTARKGALPADQRDIMRNKTVAAFLELAHSLDIANKSDYQLRAEGMAGVRFIAKNDGWEVYQPLTYEASKYLRGDDANWCTGYHNNDSYWRQYTRNGGELFIFKNLNPTDNKDVKYQVCVRNERMVDFRDARDNIASFPKFLSKSGLVDLVSKTSIGSTKEAIVAKKLQQFNGKITYSELMGIKYLGGNGNNESDSNRLNAVYKDIIEVIRVLIVDNGIRFLPEEALKDIPMESIALPPSLIGIGRNCFEGCKEIKKISIPSGVKTIPTRCFEGCSKLEEVTITEGTIAFGEKVFGGTMFDDVSAVIKSPRHKIKVPLAEENFYRKHISWIEPEAQTESLLEESVLIEKIGKKLPDWFRNYFFSADTKAKRYTTDSSNIIPKLRDAGIDIENFTVVSAPVPSNSRSPFLSSPYIPIFYVTEEKINSKFVPNGYYSYDDGDIIYIKGVNNPRYGYEARKYFDKISLTRILSVTTKFAYIDTSKPGNMVGDKRAERDERKKGRVVRKNGQEHVPVYVYTKIGDPDTVNKEYHELTGGQQRDYRDDTNRPKQDRQWTKSVARWEWGKPSKGVDKSGYIIKGAEDLSRKLNALNRKNYSQTLDNLYSRLEAIRERIQEVFSSNFSDIHSIESGSATTTANLLDSFVSTVTMYNKLLSRLDYILLLNDEERKEKELDQMFEYDSSPYYGSSPETFQSLRKKINHLDSNLKRVESAVIENLE